MASWLVGALSGDDAGKLAGADVAPWLVGALSGDEAGKLAGADIAPDLVELEGCLRCSPYLSVCFNSPQANIEAP